MMTAADIPVGASFFGTIWRSDFHEHYQSSRKPVDGSICRVALVNLDGHDLHYLLDLHATHLPAHDSAQLSDKDGTLWIAGKRATRSKRVLITAWRYAAAKSLLEQSADLLRSIEGCRTMADVLALQLRASTFVQEQVNLGRLLPPEHEH